MLMVLLSALKTWLIHAMVCDLSTVAERKRMWSDYRALHGKGSFLVPAAAHFSIRAALTSRVTHADAKHRSTVLYSFDKTLASLFEHSYYEVDTGALRHFIMEFSLADANVRATRALLRQMWEKLIVTEIRMGAHTTRIPIDMLYKANRLLSTPGFSADEGEMYSVEMGLMACVDLGPATTDHAAIADHADHQPPVHHLEQPMSPAPHRSIPGTLQDFGEDQDVFDKMARAAANLRRLGEEAPAALVSDLYQFLERHPDIDKHDEAVRDLIMTVHGETETSPPSKRARTDTASARRYPSRKRTGDTGASSSSGDGASSSETYSRQYHGPDNRDE